MREKEKSVVIPRKTAANKSPRTFALIALLLAATLLLLAAACGAAEQPAEETPSTTEERARSSTTAMPRETLGAATTTAPRTATAPNTSIPTSTTAAAPTAAPNTSTPASTAVSTPTSEPDAPAVPTWKVIYATNKNTRDLYTTVLEASSAAEIGGRLSHGDEVNVEASDPDFYGKGYFDPDPTGRTFTFFHQDGSWIPGTPPPSDWAVSSLTFFDQCPYRHSDYSGWGCIEDKAMRPAHMAPLNPSPEVTEGLLEISPKAMMQSEGRISPFQIAAAFNVHPQVMTAFLERGAIVDYEDNQFYRSESGFHPLVLAILHNPSPGVAATLLEWGVKPQLTSGDTRLTLLHLAAASNPNPEVMALLLDHGLEINAQDKRGHTPLRAALTQNPNPQAALFLLNQGADIYAGDDPVLDYTLVPTTDMSRPLPGPSPSLEIISKLLELGADTRFSGGRTALHLAAWRASPEIVQLFLDLGVNAKDSGGATPLHYAVLPVHRKALSHQPENVKLLISQGAEVDALDSQGLTPLHWAASEGAVETVEALLEAGADRQAQTPTGETPCQLARDNGKLEGSKALGTLCRP